MLLNFLFIDDMKQPESLSDTRPATNLPRESASVISAQGRAYPLASRIRDSHLISRYILERLHVSPAIFSTAAGWAHRGSVSFVLTSSPCFIAGVNARNLIEVGKHLTSPDYNC